MIQSAEFAGSFNCTDVGWLFYRADDRGISSWIAADGTGFFLGEIEALRARPDLLGQRDECIGETLALFLWLLKQMIGETKRSFSPDAGKSCELSCELVDR